MSDNRSVLAADVNNPRHTYYTSAKPEPRDGLETALHVLPTLRQQLQQLLLSTAHSQGQFSPQLREPNSAHLQLIQAGSRLGYQELPSCARSTWHRF